MKIIKRLAQASVVLLTPTLTLAEPIDLLAAYQLALEHDSEIHAAYNQLLASKEVKPQALADLLPSINATASAGHNRQKSKVTHPNGLSNTEGFEQDSFAVSLRQPLFDWANFVRFNQANERVSRAEVVYRLAEQELIFRLTERYLDTLQAEANLKVSNDDVAAFSRQLDQAKQRFDVGLIAITDVHDAQARHDLSFATQIAAEDNLYSKREALREIIQADEVSLAPLAQEFPLFPPEPNKIREWENASSQHNLSIQSAKFDVAIAKKDISITRSGHYPTIDLVASHSYNDTEGSALTGTGLNTESDQIGVELNLSLFSGGKTSSLTKQAVFNHKRSLDILQSLQRTSLREARDSFRGVIASLQQIKALKQAIVSNQSSLDASEVGLEVGTRTIVDVLDAQSNLSRAKLQIIAEKKNYILSVLSLKNAAGSLALADIEKINQWLQH